MSAIENTDRILLKMTTFALQAKKSMKKLIPFLLIAFMALGSSAQRHHEFGLFGGVSYYMGELNPSMHFKSPHPAYGLVYRYDINPHWSFKLSGIYGTLEGDDASNPDDSRRNYKLSFESPVTDISAQMELNFFKYVIGSDNHRFSPFMFAGVSVFRFNPRAYFAGNWYELQPLGTEGQGTTAYPDRKPYSLTSVAVPFGLGFKFSVSDNFAMAFEWGMRMSFTDYIDDISTTFADPYVLATENTGIAMVLGNRSMETDPHSYGEAPGYEGYDKESIAALWTDKQRGNPDNNDWYSFAGVTLTFKIRPPKQKTCPAYDTYYKFREYYLF